MSGAVSELFGGGGGPAPVSTPELPRRSANGDLAARKQLEGQRAVGGGIADGNEADYLGVVKPRRAGAARSILG